MAVNSAVKINYKEIFPSTKTETINKLITENSLTRLLNRLMDVDGYIISSEYPLNTDVNISDSYNYVNVSEYLLNEFLEVCIRGYYFNLGLFGDVLAQVRTLNPRPAEGESIVARIWVDTSNPDYPELYGQNTVEEHEFIVTNTATSLALENNFLENTITFYDTQDNPISLSYVIDRNNNNFIKADINSEGPLDLMANGVARVRYYTSNQEGTIWLDVSGQGEPESPNPDNPSLVYYELVLFELVPGEEDAYRIPLSSFHKFSSLSISNIDGGEIKEVEIPEVES